MEMAHPGAGLPKMATNRICVTTPSQYPNSLHKHDTRQEEIGYLASLADRGLLLPLLEKQKVKRRRQHHCRVQPPRSSMSCRALRKGLAVGKDGQGDEETIPGANASPY